MLSLVSDVSVTLTQPETHRKHCVSPTVSVVSEWDSKLQTGQTAPPIRATVDSWPPAVLLLFWGTNTAAAFWEKNARRGRPDHLLPPRKPKTFAKRAAITANQPEVFRTQPREHPRAKRAPRAKTITSVILRRLKGIIKGFFFLHKKCRCGTVGSFHFHLSFLFLGLFKQLPL